MKIGKTVFLTALVGIMAFLGSPAVAQQAAVKGPQDVRIEHDLLGEKAIPAGAYYGVQTARAMENFQISGRTIAD